MLSKVNQGLLATSMVISMACAPVAHAVSDEVAVQLLERLGELEKEVSNLRGENETLRNELQTIQATQREGFLEVDERVSGLEKQGTGSTGAANRLANPQNGAATSGVEVLDLSGGLNTVDEIPALEDPITRNTTNTTTTVTPAPVMPALEINVSGNPGATMSNPEDRKAVAPVEVNLNKAESVNPASPQSYYYYGTDDKNTAPANSTTGANRASLIQPGTPAPANNKGIPDAHKAKAQYNEAYKLLVNDPKLAVPAFRGFLSSHPKHELAANAQYWLGEALYAQKDYSGASQEFMKVLKQYKSSPKAPGAALKLGYSFYELRQWDFARRTLEDTVRFFPESNSAKLAKNRLERMKAAGH